MSPDRRRGHQRRRRLRLVSRLLESGLYQRKVHLMPDRQRLLCAARLLWRHVRAGASVDTSVTSVIFQPERHVAREFVCRTRRWRTTTAESGGSSGTASAGSAAAASVAGGGGGSSCSFSEAHNSDLPIALPLLGLCGLALRRRRPAVSQ